MRIFTGHSEPLGTLLCKQQAFRCYRFCVRLAGDTYFPYVSSVGELGSTAITATARRSKKNAYMHDIVGCKHSSLHIMFAHQLEDSRQKDSSLESCYS